MRFEATSIWKTHRVPAVAAAVVTVMIVEVMLLVVEMATARSESPGITKAAKVAERSTSGIKRTDIVIRRRKSTSMISKFVVLVTKYTAS